MITFKSININEEIREWEFESAEAIEKAWKDIDGEGVDLPANDDPIFDVVVDGKEDIEEATFERIGTDSVWFEDLLTYLGIEIW